MILGFIAVIFAHAMPIIVVELQLLTQGSISPFYQYVFVEKRFYSNPELTFCCGCILCFGMNWFGVELGKNYLDKPSVERNFIDSSIGAGFSFLHTLKSIAMEGIA